LIENTQIYNKNYTTGDKYILSFYYCLLTMVGNDLLPGSYLEVGFAALFILIGSIVIGTIIGEFSTILSDISKKAR
jgi:hypothetical protein